MRLFVADLFHNVTFHPGTRAGPMGQELRRLVNPLPSIPFACLVQSNGINQNGKP